MDREGEQSDILRDQPELVRMSDVLIDFIEPYADAVDSLEAYRSLLTIAIAAWNIALAPEESRSAFLDEMFETFSQIRASFYWEDGGRIDRAQKQTLRRM